MSVLFFFEVFFDVQCCFSAPILNKMAENCEELAADALAGFLWCRFFGFIFHVLLRHVNSWMNKIFILLDLPDS